ncbi:hypothetical protein [Lachnoclostridium phytofermentans]|uniref:DUF5050 domain-containing protein n=1 Tax=Lachnoclostridium phytofermentans (strain ATCC 700394 / DSM 18823 / ISDg) TaxID=357809 RepID=A9KIK8_LACP7|nr:hypothetical protein [Lachnoclostridium phytofermentans]ABX42460.1 hypothetical protein Cphy_2092 [Lachnoclostridium phytofermentans ISDg]
MKKTYNDELDNSIKIEIPELEVEWPEIDITNESNNSDLAIDPEKNPNDFIPMAKYHKWKKYRLHITIAGIILGMFLMTGFIWYNIYGPFKSKLVFDLNALDNIYSYLINKDNQNVYLILDESADVLYEENTSDNSPYQYSVLNQKVHWYLKENKLFYLTSKGSQMVTDNVIEFLPSRDGLKVFYIVNQEDNSSLYEYKLESDSSVLIDNNVVDRDFCISPDSNIVAYQKLTTENNVTETYFYTQGNKLLKGTNMIPIAISNNGTQFYYVQNGNLIVQSDGFRNQLMKVPNNDLTNLLLFNQDHTELEYINDNNWYLSMNGKAGVKLKYYEILNVSWYLKFGVYLNYWNTIFTFNIPHLSEIQTFTKSLTYQDWLDNTKKSYGIISNNKLFYLSDGAVYFMESQPDKPDKITKISGDLYIKQLVPSEDNSFCYVLTVVGDLYQIDMNGNQKLCLNRVTEIFQNYWQGEEEFYFGRKSSRTIVSSSGSLYQLFYRKEDNTITEVEGADCVTIISDQYRVIYQDVAYQSDYYYYMLKNGKGIKVNFPLNSDN